jgi:predicted ATPase/class 3 adenylate cyclase/DNA-binding CsgD family transcriptional regulator
MFGGYCGRMLASMSGHDSRAETLVGNESDLDVSVQLPTGTVTLLLADVEGSTRLWENQPDAMAAAVAVLDRTVSEVVTVHGGVRPVEQGEGDSFVAAFARAGDAVECALALQQAPLASIRLRIGLHTGDVLLRDDGNYAGPTINRTARLRDLAHGGQTVVSGTTADVVIDRLPANAWLRDLGTHTLRDLPRPERVMQLCHPDLMTDFPPLRTRTKVTADHLPVPLTTFVGRHEQVNDLLSTLSGNRLVTLTGAGGVGKTRLAIKVAAQAVSDFPDGLWYVDLAPITDPALLATTVARVLGLSDQPGRSTTDTLVGFVGAHQILIVLDNCEHLLDASAALIHGLLGSCPRLTFLTTSREPIGVVGEITRRVPSLSLTDEAIELFTDRARLVRPEFTITDDNAAAVSEICHRLDGMPLAIELAAARVRALSVSEIVDGLHDRFRLLTGGGRTSVRRQQTLRASVDWSHALLTETERILFRRLAAFVGGCDLHAAAAVAGDAEVERYQVLDQLTLLVDKSLVVVDDSTGGTRYRLLETVRQYALEKLSESGEADAMRTRHRDHYMALAAQLDAPAQSGHVERIVQVEAEMDNLRAAFAWSRENGDDTLALHLASCLQPLWFGRGRLREGSNYFDSILNAPTPDHPSDVPPGVLAAALSDMAMLNAWMGGVRAAESMEQAQQALAIAREVGDPALLGRALTACGSITGFNAEAAELYLSEAIAITRSLGDAWRLSQILNWQAIGAFIAGHPIVGRAAAEEGRDLADAIGNPFDSRQCRVWLGWAHMMQADLAGAIAGFDDVIAEAERDADGVSYAIGLTCLGQALAYRGEISRAHDVARVAREATAQFEGLYLGTAHAAIAYAALAAGEREQAWAAGEAAWPYISSQPDEAAIYSALMAQTALARGDATAARRFAEHGVNTTGGWHQMAALIIRARVAAAQGEPEQARDDAHAALVCGTDADAFLGVPDALECLAALAADAGSHADAARLLGAAAALRQRTGERRFLVYQNDYDSTQTAIRGAIGELEFDAAYADGAALPTEAAIAYAQRGRGERKRPTTGWASLTPTEREVVRRVSEGLSNKDIGTRLFISPRTVQTHLTHVYTKLALTSRVQLVQEAARHP